MIQDIHQYARICGTILMLPGSVLSREDKQALFNQLSKTCRHITGITMQPRRQFALKLVALAVATGETKIRAAELAATQLAVEGMNPSAILQACKEHPEFLSAEIGAVKASPDLMEGAKQAVADMAKNLPMLSW